jgi:hypothetical protein
MRYNENTTMQHAPGNNLQQRNPAVLVETANACAKNKCSIERMTYKITPDVLRQTQGLNEKSWY